MRLAFALVAAMLVAQCASGEDRRFRVGESADGLVIIGLAETSSNRDPVYSMLWRKLDDDGAFTEYDDSRAIAARTNSGSSVRLRGIPGEFEILRVNPGLYALDGTFATLRENGLSYFAQGFIVGPQRPSFEVRAGEAVYLGIWEMDLQGADATTHLWRLDESDLHALERVTRNALVGEAKPVETHNRAVACQPHRISNLSQRQVC